MIPKNAKSERWSSWSQIFTGAHVIEVGCGDGRLTKRYAERAASVLAFDPDEVAIAALRSDLPPGRVEVRTDTVDRVDIPEESADIVLLSWAL